MSKSTTTETKMSKTSLVKILREEHPNTPFSDNELIAWVAKNENNSFSPTLVELARNLNTPRVKVDWTRWNGEQR
jgi:hypothetical protein